MFVVIVMVALRMSNTRVSGPVASKARARNILKDFAIYGINMAAQKVVPVTHPPPREKSVCFGQMYF